MATTAIQLQSAPLVVAQPPLPQRPANSGKCLAVTQLVIGILAGLIGIASIASLHVNNWATNTAAGIWAGGWIGLTGIIGVCSSQNRNNLNCVYMAFSIICTCASALAGLFFVVVVAFYAVVTCESREYIRGVDDWSIQQSIREYSCSSRNIALGLHVPLLLLMIVEFFVSIIAAVLCCKNGCGNASTQGVVIHQQPYIPVVSTTGGTAVITQGVAYPANVQYPTQGTPQYVVQGAPQYGGQGAPQYGGQGAPQYGGQMAPQYGGQMAPQYGGQVAPQYGMQVQPPYNPHAPPPYGAPLPPKV